MYATWIFRNFPHIIGKNCNRYCYWVVRYYTTETVVEGVKHSHNDNRYNHDNHPPIIVIPNI